ncbi:hypothetical protein QTG54_006742 [Skeletonema marinoi]|uniref:Glycosyltransferase family 92 protein n=1 Tax=Skeletonema marinoi TaxID=267567 RepID=A0AAD8YB11_9STRA|nr:hypothetical protein QTG54_006742 [Skeletonema marinoi]
MIGDEPVSYTGEKIWHHNYTIIVSLSLLVISCGSCCCFRNCYRVRTGRVGYFIIYPLAATSLVFQYLLLSKLIAQDKFISYDDVWHETLKLSPPTTAAPSAAISPESSHDNQQLKFPPWSACLLIKDNNIILPEWLAYHYTVLPLRRLIVAVDPTSKTDPRYIFDQYKSIGMNVTVWTDDDYWVDGAKDHEQRNFRITNETLPAYAQDRLVHRQKIFYHGCLKQLKRENRTWTAVVDADEYIAFNYLDESSSEGPSWCYTKHRFDGHLDERRQCKETCSSFNLTCDTVEKDKFYCEIPHCANQEQRKSFRTKLNQSATAAEHIHKHFDRQFDMHDCIVLARYLFSSGESSRSVIEKGVDEAFNATLFHTLRYRLRTDLDNAQPGKSIIDVSRYHGRTIKSPHRLHSKCLSEGNAWVENFMMSFRVHHYVGSWESFRLRGHELFVQRNNQSGWVVDNTTPQYTAKEGTRTWLSQFTMLVGSEKALDLTERIRVREEREVEQIFIELSEKS